MELELQLKRVVVGVGVWECLGWIYGWKEGHGRVRVGI